MKPECFLNKVIYMIFFGIFQAQLVINDFQFPVYAFVTL